MSKISLKTKKEIAIMRAGGKIAGEVLAELSKATKPGVTTLELNDLAEKIIISHGATASFKGFKGYPAATCISVNNEVVHGIPSNRKLVDGDVVGIDVGVFYQGLHTDTAVTVGVGKVSEKAQKMINITKQSLENGLSKIKAGVYLGDAQAEIQKTLETGGLGVIRDLTGHGVGRELQESPAIANYGRKGQGLILEEGMTLAIEPMSTMGDWHVLMLDDGWTVVTADNSLSAHFEPTIVVTKDGYEILTKL